MASATPHDALFKYVFTRPEEAASLLQAFLPSAVVAAVDWPSLSVAPGSFVDPSLSTRHTDLLCSCVLVDGHEAELFVVLEHQSGEEALMAYRMARYVGRVLDRWLAAREGARTLPVVVPLVIHHGPRRWRGSPELRDAFAAPPEVLAALGPAVPSLRFLLEDLTAAEEAALGRRALTASAELTLRALARLPRSADPAGDVRRWLGLLGAMMRAPDGLARLAAFVNYVRSVAEVDDEALRGVFVELGPTAEEVVMTAAERLREEGREQGREEGREQGRRAQAAATLLELMTERFGAVPDAVSARVQSPDVELTTLGRWTRRVLSAATADEVLRAEDERPGH